MGAAQHALSAPRQHAVGLAAGARPTALIKGAGDLATGVALRLLHSGFAVVMTELPRPTVIRRTVAFAEAVYADRVIVEGVEALRAGPGDDLAALLRRGVVPVVVDPDASVRHVLHPELLVDAVIAKRNTGTRIDDAPVVVALGPGFCAGRDVHAVIETQRGHTLGRVIRDGEALADTGVPGEVGGFAAERVLRAPCAGSFHGLRQIGDRLACDDVVAEVDGKPVRSTLDGVLRGLLHTGLPVTPGYKVGDVDPRAAREHCFLVSDKALSVAGGVLEAACALLGGPRASSAGGVLTHPARGQT